ncbi:response regulator transcription factor [Enterococcus faecalis]|uniref:response regulator transcription factor n=1 Tax=Enterococcus faecalis TaxID=1351 RepID=UPI0022E5B171|nr:response regulator transcription factor [Enterococcus faecalis]
MKILLVDDHKLIGKSLEMTLKNYADVKEFRYISDPITVFEMIETYRPSIILMDIHMGMFNGLELGEEVLRKTKTKLVFLSGFDLAEYRDKAIGIGANGFLDKHIAVDSLIENLKKISYEDKKIFPQTSRHDLKHNLITPREKEVLRILSQGVKQSAIASKMNITDQTLRNYVYSINEKLETNSAIASVVKAIELGIINVRLQ